MPISMGIICEACGMVHLVTATANKAYRLPATGRFGNVHPHLRRLPDKRSFHESDLTPYSVSSLGYIKG